MQEQLNPAVIDWVHSDFPAVEEVAKTAGSITPEATATEAYLKDHIDRIKSTLKTDWVLGILEVISLPTGFS